MDGERLAQLLRLSQIFTVLGIGEVKRLRNGMAVAFPFPLPPAEVG